MNPVKDTIPLTLPFVINEDLASNSAKRDVLGKSNVVHMHVEPILSNSVAPSSHCKTHSGRPDSHIVDIGHDLDGATADDDDEDSGLPDLSLNADLSLRPSGCLRTCEGCSASACDDSEEDRPGSFDYMPSQSGHVRVTHTFSPPYDEEVKLDSSSTVESPRSENSVTHEECSVAKKVDTLVSKETSQSHGKHKHPFWDYMPCGKQSDDEDMEDEEDERDRIRGLTSTSSFGSSFPTTTRQVDECVSYNLKPLNNPSDDYNHQRIKPLSGGLYQDQYIPEGAKEKDKKKSRSKDDSDKPELPGPVDVNGNPQPLDLANYLQMRQWPRGKSENSVSGSQSGYTPITIPQSQSPSSGVGDPNTFDRKKERRRMKLERLKGTPAEEYKGHRNFNDIKDILAFVEGPNKSPKEADNRPKEAESKSSLTKKKQERTRKKDNHLNGPQALEDASGAEDAPSKEELLAVTADVKPALQAMGNSFKRTDGHEKSISKTCSEDDEVDKNSSEFHDCLSTVPAELVTSEVQLATSEADLTFSSSKQQERLTVTPGNVIKRSALSFAVADKPDSLSSGESNAEKHLTDNSKEGTKKSIKPKNKKEKHIGSQSVSPKSDMVKPTETMAFQDSLLQTSDLGNESIKFQNFIKEPLTEVKREDSFTEVKKKKKRLGGKDSTATVTSHSFSSSYHSYINNVHSRTHAGPPPPVASSTAAVSIRTSLPSNSQTYPSRDLSPSAFPVLSSQSPPGTFHAEARRNSCGDINADFMDSKTYDSDRESAKSLPAAHGARVGGELLPIYPVSYARMAAAPPKNDSTNSPNSESGIASISRNSSIASSFTHTLGTNTASVLFQLRSNPATTPERKATVWKGSPRERRHSIGSSPEDVTDGEKSSVAERNRQCGSQEVLSRSIAASAGAASKDAQASPLPIKLTHTCEDHGSFHSNNDLQREIVTPVGKFLSNQLMNTIPSNQLMTKSPGQNLSSSKEYATTNISSSSQTSSAIAALRPGASSPSKKPLLTTTVLEIHANMETQSRKTKQELSSQPLVQTVTLSVTDGSFKNHSSKNKLVSGAVTARKNSTKSVIFLGKPFDFLPPQNLGITFGFDLSCDSKCEPTSQPSSQQPQQLSPSHPRLASAVPQSLLQSSSTDSSVQPSHQQQVSCPEASRELPHIPSSAQMATALPDSQFPTTSTLKSSDTNNSHVLKGPHIHGPRNGLILPSNPTRNCSTQSDQVNTSSSNFSSSVNTKNLDLAASKRTRETPDDTASPNLNSVVYYDPLVLSALPSAASSSLMTNSPFSQANAAMVKSTVNIAQANPDGVTSSHTSHPLQLPKTAPTEDTDSSTSSLPSAQGQMQPSTEHQGCPESTFIVSASNPSLSTKLEETEDALETPETAIATPGLTSPLTDPLSPHQTVLVPTEVQPPAKSVIYGLKIKPSVGCGKLLFVSSISSKTSRANSSEIACFLRKKWLDDVIQKKMGSGTFATLVED